jgi:uncharacterized protein (TIGR02453 family)
MPGREGVFSQDTFRFFLELARNNHKPWMDANRERYRAVVTEPFRVLLEQLAPAVQKLNPKFVVTGRVGDNFSRINRDIRFARDKSPYRAQMYLFFTHPGSEGGQLYVGLSAETVTAGFRIYNEGRHSPLVQYARVRGPENAKWVERQERRLSKKYESYWYSSGKGDWTKHRGWPASPGDWKKLQAWIVRRKFPPAAATRRGFDVEAARIFRELYPLYQLTSSPVWKP